MIDLTDLLKELGNREITTVIVEGGSVLLGNFFDRRLVDKIYAFVAPIIIGGEGARTAVGGKGIDRMSEALQLKNVRVQSFDNDFLISGYL